MAFRGDRGSDARVSKDSWGPRASLPPGPRLLSSALDNRVCWATGLQASTAAFLPLPYLSEENTELTYIFHSQYFSAFAFGEFAGFSGLNCY